jgi:O-6-methylguanine DNA methyltransferase
MPSTGPILRVVTRTIESPVGPLLAGVTEPVDPNEGPSLCLLEFTSRPRLSQAQSDLARLLACPLEEQGEFETATPATRLLDETQHQLDEYFANQRTAFDLPLLLPGTPFQQKVWHALTEIPFGTTISYDTLAKRVGSVARAVGGANGANRVPIVVPCHRVIGADGSLTGFGGGMHIKQRLLELERAITPELFA